MCQLLDYFLSIIFFFRENICKQISGAPMENPLSLSLLFFDDSPKVKSFITVVDDN